MATSTRQMMSESKKGSRQSSYFALVNRSLFDPSFPMPMLIILFIAEIVVNLVVIVKIKYTEIDWIAYMQEVEGVVNGTYDYLQLKGDTGPLVYPAGFVYIFMGFYYLTEYGANIHLAQYMFAAIYMLNLLIVFDIYRQAKKIPPFAFFFMCALSYRIHSIYVLRLFNDPVAMLFLYISVNMFMRSHWSWGCLLYSLGVSIKMNLLLYSPALLVLLIASQGIKGTIKHLTICALPQVILALPFLATNPWGYIVRSFDLGRQFFYVWTVNWRLLPEEVFLNKYFQAGLLLMHVLVLILFFWFKWRPCIPSLKFQWSSKGCKPNLSADHILLTKDFASNFIGMCFSRSLHYQFYVWYFHSLHYLVWCTPYPNVLRILLLGVIEFCWNTYPSTVLSSSLLHASHLFILLGLWLVLVKTGSPSAKSQKDSSIGKVKMG
ncbi:dol-P-Man:Man(5)GlcNAc(2)-PP-Dol alpha-1 3-mannosyltransferase [Biomphalaria pfeifferi]|uniref:dolichyl-P-Man:Man5GlcNAc2-PP-dolichol alpha-1,3-mannosyltransferase n=1 Tax=Biomphalaria pfeifferi TaxID=112525 RepID=A0AAD8BV57_BIOPF|nr:dol-P-Man:Man(5)GlcNAc(2)-PP-Dol alpha-1 3-mannosyltransferase [Biomphalaria pfeifferi]